MKLATLKDSTRDGKLVVVSKDLTRCSEVGHIARTLQAALDDWEHVSPRLALVAEGLENGAQPYARFHEHDAASPLPRAYQWALASAHQGQPLIRQGASDSFIGPRDAIALADPAHGLDVEGDVAVITGDVAVGASEEDAKDAIKLLLLVNDLSLSGLDAGEADAGGLCIRPKPSSAFSPVAVTPDELGDAWHGGKLHLPLLVSLNGKPVGKADASAGFDFARLIAHAAKTRRLTAGSIIGSGAAPGAQADGAAKTLSLKAGDRVSVEIRDRTGHSIFGAIDQLVN
jgi:fumarylacetoacetate (FAA) hydrolase